MTLIETPVPGYTGDGPGGLHFVDGAAETDDPAIIGYCRGAGYIVDGELTNPLAATTRIDSRNVTTARIGTPARDAAVDRRPEDHLSPRGAGDGDPHGPEVVAPGLAAALQQQLPPAESPEQNDNGPDRPGPAAPVAEWRAYAQALADGDPEACAEIEKATKAELIKAYGG